MICNECETVAHCTKHGCIPKHQALEKMAENARELGLDYEQYKGAIEVSAIFHEGQRMFAVPKQPAQTLPFGVGGCLVAIKTLLSRDPCVHANTAIQMIDAILAEHPAQRTWVGLSEEEKIKCASPYDSRLCCVEETEAKLKEKNT